MIIGRQLVECRTWKALACDDAEFVCARQEQVDLLPGFAIYFERSCTVMLGMLGRAYVIQRLAPDISLIQITLV